MCHFLKIFTKRSFHIPFYIISQDTKKSESIPSTKEGSFICPVINFRKLNLIDATVFHTLMHIITHLSPFFYIFTQVLYYPNSHSDFLNIVCIHNLLCIFYGFLQRVTNLTAFNHVQRSLKYNVINSFIFLMPIVLQHIISLKDINFEFHAF